jgi:hypothetical protein
MNNATLKTLRFGIEIETVGLDRERLARAIQGAVGGTVGSDYRSWHVTDAKARTWRVVPDGSLSGGERSGEIVSPILAYEDIEYPFTRSLADRGIALCGSILRVMTRIRCPLA